MNAIETRGISKRYGDVTALRDVSISIGKGEIVGLLGPNGAGKTTLMKILTGYLQPDEGEAKVAGVDVVSDPLGAQRHIGYLPEHAPLYQDMAVQEYLQMMAALRQVPEGEQRKRLGDAIRATGLEGYLTRPIGKLSKGYRQRVGIAQAIVHRPELLILDEPTTGLDPSQIVEIRELIRSLAKGATVLLSTHILSEVEMTCERVLIITRGRLRADSRLADLRAGHAAVVAVQQGAAAVEDALRRLDGATGVEAQGADGGFQRFRITSERPEIELCAAIYDLARSKDWRLSELRPDTRTLESVFRELAESANTSDN